ncbi:MAG: LytTR family DNA-binding domain-containing protein [Rhodocyclaceae bacterium]|nr:LytTR family DNA-binding domain-containing protein [Rhodocyclaceae bacterium]
MTPLRILLVDDEKPARVRLRQLLDDLAARLATRVVDEAADGVEALEKLAERMVDVVLVDIRMPRLDGLQLALHIARLPQPPAVIFVTAYDKYAVQAFELAAVDYLLKPVRAERLEEALRKIRRGFSDVSLHSLAPQGRLQLRCSERGRVSMIPLDEVLYFKAELKYVTVRTARGEHLLEESLTQLESEFGARFLRVHRNCLVARNAIAGYERGTPKEGETEAQWLLLLQGSTEKIPVSRRQWAQVKAAIKGE